MSPNDILRRIRYTFDLNDDTMMAIFALADHPFTRAEISDWLKREDDPAFKPLEDINLAIFLNGFISHKRGKKEGPQPAPEKFLNNNLILRKLKIALALRDEDMQEIFGRAGVAPSIPEITALFRNPQHKHYRHCNDQFLRKFLEGMQVRFRG